MKVTYKNILMGLLLAGVFAGCSSKDVEYDGEVYQIKNHFFPFPLEEIKNWEITDSDISMQFATAENRFVAKWLSENELTIEAQDVINIGKEIYKYYFRNLHN